MSINEEVESAELDDSLLKQGVEAVQHRWGKVVYRAKMETTLRNYVLLVRSGTCGTTLVAHVSNYGGRLPSCALGPRNVLILLLCVCMCVIAQTWLRRRQSFIV